MKRHRFDPVSFVFGLLFVAVAAAVALPAEPLDLLFLGNWSLAWVPPVVLVGIGLALLAPLLPSRPKEAAPPIDDEPPDGNLRL